MINGTSHDPAQCIYLLDQMTLSYAANSRITGHMTQCFDVMGQQHGLHAHASGSGSSFSTGMAATNDDNVELLMVLHRITSNGTSGSGCQRRVILSGSPAEENDELVIWIRET